MPTTGPVWVLDEDEAVELLAYLITAARTQVDEAAEYGPMRRPPAAPPAPRRARGGRTAALSDRRRPDAGGRGGGVRPDAAAHRRSPARRADRAALIESNRRLRPRRARPGPPAGRAPHRTRGVRRPPRRGGAGTRAA